ncbi:hypothetical protein JKF63_04016 [Porcisia hertigi]|uniref:Uncharacterized protein n=1 Tax=Porcisia hertigi TaxID=2761500 RepID=A0A836L4A1_9TRYP|nr:hypothetical protein JKF63_04016 [Porcisia hertigi]
MPAWLLMEPPAAGEEGERRSLCSGLSGVYSVGLHVCAIFLILFVSLLGVAMPIMTKYIALFLDNPFAFTVGKTAATGVLLSVSTIHLIHEGAEGFREECVYDFFKGYKPFYFLFALAAVLMMQAIDLQLAAIAERWLRASQQRDVHGMDVVVVDEDNDAGAVDGSSAAVAPEGEGLVANAGPTHLNLPNIEWQAASWSPAHPGADDYRVALMKAKASSGDVLSSGHYSQGHSHADHDAHGHQHLTVAPPMNMGSIRRVISAVCMEFGVTLHSIFVGLTVGLTTDNQLKPLLVALVFHQLFEGMAMGSRLVDADFAGNLETYLALVFSFSAPAGMAIGTIAVSVSPNAMSGSGFATMIAILDSMCGGILLYLAFTLLLGDFVADVKHYCADGLPGRRRRKIALYVSLWAGMGLMAYVGMWL